MYLIFSLIIVFACLAIWIGSAFAVINKWTKNNVPTNILSVLIFLCPVINTLLALYYAYPEYKETLSKIFKNN